MALSFSDAVKKFANSPKAIEAIHKTSLEKLDRELTRTKAEGGSVPVDTGNLYRSLVASTSGMPTTSVTRSSGSNVTAVIAQLRPNQSIWLGYTATYARRMNFGFVGADSLGRVYNQQGNYFVERAIAMWPQLVDEAIKEVTSGN